MSARILVVDDEADVEHLFRQHFRRELREGRYVIHFAQSGKEALDTLTLNVDSFAVVYTDINMPEMDGLTLLRKVKECRADLPVIMISAYDDDEIRRAARDFGASDFVNKPVDFQRLGQSLQQFSA